MKARKLTAGEQAQAEAWELTHSLLTPEQIYAKREAERIAQAAELTAELRRPLGDVSAKAGEMERKAPLFYGKGDNPLLF